MLTPTLKDVAREAGVSSATVSRYLNGTARLTDSTRADVERAIRGLGYRPNRVARRLRVTSGHAHLIGLLIPDMQNPFFTDIGRGVEDLARARGYTVILGHSDDSVPREELYLDLFRSESVDGIILPTVRQGHIEADDLTRDGIPVVCVDRSAACCVDTVVSDNERGAREATDHLIGLGHRRIGFVSGLPDISTSRERLAGYRAALGAAGLEAEAFVRAGDSRQQSGLDRTRELLDLPDPPTAILAGNNLMTLGALSAIRERGLRVPQDLSLVSYDDVPWASAFNPPLTAVSQPGYEMGRHAAALLLRRIESPDVPVEVTVLEPSLIVRGSSGKAPG